MPSRPGELLSSLFPTRSFQGRAFLSLVDQGLVLSPSRMVPWVRALAATARRSPIRKALVSHKMAAGVGGSGFFPGTGGSATLSSGGLGPAVFDHLVGDCEHAWRHCEAEGLRRYRYIPQIAGGRLRMRTTPHSYPHRAFHQRHWLCTAAMVLMPVSAPIKVLV
jgi:hypothetical protein